MSRHALVIGISAYQRAPSLRNPVNDATKMAHKLEQLGYEVELEHDLNVYRLERCVSEFLRKLERHAPDASAPAAIIYFAGHGVQVKGENYLLAADADIHNELDLQKQTVCLTPLLTSVTRAARPCVLLLDCCRNNPLPPIIGPDGQTRALTADHGMAALRTRMNGAFVAYATAPDSVAEDGKGDNSPFTQALLEFIEEPVSIFDMMLRVRNSVYKATSGRQVPWEQNWLFETFGLNPKASSLAPIASDPAAEQKRREQEYWELIRRSDNLDLLRSFVQQFPNSEHKQLAYSRMEELSRARWRRNFVAAAALALVLGILGAYAAVKGVEARKNAGEARQAYSRLMGAYSLNEVRNGDPITGMLLALEGAPADPKEKPELNVSQGLYQGWLAGEREQRIVQIREPIRALSPNGKSAISNVADEQAKGLKPRTKLRVWDVESGNDRGAPLVYDDAVYAHTFSADSTRIATIGEEGVARVWTVGQADAPPLRIPPSTKGPGYYVSFSPDGRLLATGSDKKISLWDAVTGVPVRSIDAPAAVDYVAFSPDSLKLVSVSVNDFPAIWDVRTGDQLSRFEDSDVPTARFATFSPDGRWVLILSFNGTGRLWDAQSYQRGNLLKAPRHSITHAAFSPDGTLVATTAYKEVRVWSVATGQQQAILRGHEGSILEVLFIDHDKDHDSQIVTLSSDRTIRYWPAKVTQRARVDGGPDDPVTSVDFAPDKRRFAIGTKGGNIRIWDADKSAVLLQIRGHEKKINSLVFGSGEGERLLTSSNDNTAKLWDTQSGVLLATFSHDDAVLSAQFSKDGQLIVTASSDKKAKVWEASSGNLISELEGNTRGLTQAVFSPDAQRVVTGSSNGSVKIWDISDRKPVALLNEPIKRGASIRRVAYNADGTRLMVGTSFSSSIWDTGKFTRVGGSLTSTQAMFSPDGKYFLSLGFDTTVRYRNSSDNRDKKELKGHELIARLGAFSLDGRILVTASPELEPPFIWSWSERENILSLPEHDSPISNLAVSDDGRYVATVTRDGFARVWPIYSTWQVLAEQVQATLPRCLSQRQREKLSLKGSQPAWCANLAKRLPEMHSAISNNPGDR